MKPYSLLANQLEVEPERVLASCITAGLCVVKSDFLDELMTRYLDGLDRLAGDPVGTSRVRLVDLVMEEVL